jgi:hypothetical protein
MSSPSACKLMKMETKQLDQMAKATAAQRVMLNNSLIGCIMRFLSWKNWFANQRVCRAWGARIPLLLDSIQQLSIGQSYEYEPVLNQLKNQELTGVLKLISRPTLQTLTWRGSPSANGSDKDFVFLMAKAINSRSAVLQSITLVGGDINSHRNGDVNDLFAGPIQNNKNLHFFHFFGQAFFERDPQPTWPSDDNQICLTCLAPFPPGQNITQCEEHTSGRDVCTSCVIKIVEAQSSSATTKLLPCGNSRCTRNMCPLCEHQPCVVCGITTCDICSDECGSCRKAWGCNTCLKGCGDCHGTGMCPPCFDSGQRPCCDAVDISEQFAADSGDYDDAERTSEFARRLCFLDGMNDL